MDSPLQDERIHAFLDGELPAEERAEFERQMADSAELRQSVEELRAVRESLQTLPRHRLEEDFSARILKRAERAMLADRPQTGQASAAPAGQSSPVEPARPEPYRSRRPWIWAAVTVAAAVLLMVLNPAQRNAKVAMQDKPAAGNAAGKKVAQGDEVNDLERAHGVESISASPVASPADPRGAINKVDSKGADIPRNGYSGAPANVPAERDAAKQPQSKGRGDVNFAADKPAEERPVADGRVAGEGAGEGAGGRKMPAAGLSAAAPAPHKENESLACQMKMRAADMRPVLHGPPNEQIVVAEFTAAQKISAAGLPAILAKRGITLVHAPNAPKRDKAVAGKPGSELGLAGAAAGLPAPQPATKVGPAAQGGPAKSAPAKSAEQPFGSAKQAKQAEQVEVIYVEASREQVSGLLQDLRSQPGTFGFVSASVASEAPAAKGPAAAAAPSATAGVGGIAGGGQGANRSVAEDGKKADGKNADAEKPRAANAAGGASTTPDDSKSKFSESGGGKSQQDSGNRKRLSTEPTAYATQIDSVPPGAEELLQLQQPQQIQQPPLPQQAPQTEYGRRGPPQSDNKDLQDRSGSSRPAAAPSEQAPAAANPEPNQRLDRGEADKLPYASPRGGENGANQRNLANQQADQAAAGAKSPSGRGSPAADSAFSQFDSASALGDESPDRVRAVFVFRLGSPAAASQVPVAPAAPSAPAIPTR